MDLERYQHRFCFLPQIFASSQLPSENLTITLTLTNVRWFLGTGVPSHEASDKLHCHHPFFKIFAFLWVYLSLFPFHRYRNRTHQFLLKVPESDKIIFIYSYISINSFIIFSIYLNFIYLFSHSINYRYVSIYYFFLNYKHKVKLHRVVNRRAIDLSPQ